MIDKIWLSPDCHLIMNLKSNEVHPYFKYDNKIEVQKALDLFKWQLVESPQSTESFEEANYKIMTYVEYNQYRTLCSVSLFLRSISNKFYIVFLDDEEFKDAMSITQGTEYKWQWKYSDRSPGYEVTSRGDRRFSPFFQKVEYNDKLITAEEWYKQVLEPAKLNGTKVIGEGHKFMKEYLNRYKGLFYELAIIGVKLPFTDMFDKVGGQNKWYAEFLNEYRIENYGI